MKSLRFFIAPLFAVALIFASATLYSVGVVHAKYTGQETPPQKPTFHYICPMHSDVSSSKPGKCYKCKMKLEKKRIKETRSTQQWG